MKTEILRMEHISKSHNGVRILDDFRLNVFKGEVLGIAGLSGAGKTTVANILAGLETFDSGSIYYQEESLLPLNRTMPKQPDIYNIHNAVRLAPQVSVAENIFVIKRNSYKKILINQRAMHQQTKALLAQVGLKVNPQTTAGELSFSEQHLVELAKAKAQNAKLIILDEITESYTFRELARLKEAIDIMRKTGMAFIYETNNPHELLDFADRIAVMRDGKNVATLHRDEFDKNKIISLLVGSEFRERLKKEYTGTTELVMHADNLSTDRISDVSFRLHKGEVLGILDIENKGNMEIYHVLSGALQPSSGHLYLEGRRLASKDIRGAIEAGIGFIPEQAIEDRVFPNMNFVDNISFQIIKKISNPLMSVSNKTMNYLAGEYGRLLGISPEEKDVHVRAFDVYTRQRIMLYRWLVYRPKVLVCANLGAMLDVVTKKMTYAFIHEAARQGIGILLATSDLSEAAVTCDRLLVLAGNHVKGEYSRQEMQELSIDHLV